MSTVVFLGPSLSLSEAKDQLPATFLPPASQGDIYRAVKKGARLIGIVDGFFEQVPAVWHKEILWAMSQGVHVYGASSMGALRAAELACFGMVGIGKVFQAYYEAKLEDDDEVAITHGPAELGYPKLSEAMVNIRATLDRAENERVISKIFRAQCEETARSYHFSSRSYERLLSALEGQADNDEIARLRGWLPHGKVDIKREDAVELLKVLSEQQAQATKPKEVSYSFAHTDTWEKLIRQVEASESSEEIDDLLDELRLNPKRYGQIIEGAVARALALREADRTALAEQPEKFQYKLHSFFVKRDIIEGPDIQKWLEHNRLVADELISLIKREQRIETIRAGLELEIKKSLVDVLRSAGIYGDLLEKIADKNRLVSAVDLDIFFETEDNPSADQLLSWHFNERLETGLPAHLDSHITGLGLKSRRAFLQTLARDYLYEAAVSSIPQLEGSEATN
ncbi:TfuA-like protein [Flexibacterium corallicola]|uniref:TfuA-like protein n=1 Tax=Flexibacterium corallicola TaxID=3037259 RepID=UPI00286EB9AC|nr:TfuA-like protein [Pseudovibrio sp. M1P-2-3]